MRLFSQIIGTGPPLLIMHGLFGMSDNWVTIGRRLSQQGYGVHLLDLRNHGRSPHATTHTFQDMCDDILSYLDQQKLGKVTVIGHSMGGKVAMYLALLHPDKLSDLVVVDIAPATYCCHEGSLHAVILDHLMDMDPAAYQSRGAITAELERRLGEGTLVMFLVKNIRRNPDGTYSWKPNLPSLKAYLPTLYAGFEDISSHAPCTVRTLFVKGNHSHYITPEHEPDRLRYFTNSRLTAVDNAGHWLHAEQPDTFLHIVTGFLKKP